MEPNSENKQKGNTVLLTVIAVATLLVAVIGATFAYFSITVTGNDTSSTSVYVKTATLGINYAAGQDLVVNNIQPSNTAEYTKEFTVTSNGDYDMNYKIVWKDVTNSFADPSELTYTLAGTVTTGSGTAGQVSTATAMPTGAGNMVASITIEPGAVHTYTLTVKFPDTSSEQNYNQGKTFQGKIEVEPAA